MSHDINHDNTFFCMSLHLSAVSSWGLFVEIRIEPTSGHFVSSCARVLVYLRVYVRMGGFMCLWARVRACVHPSHPCVYAYRYGHRQRPLGPAGRQGTSPRSFGPAGGGVSRWLRVPGFFYFTFYSFSSRSIFPNLFELFWNHHFSFFYLLFVGPLGAPPTLDKWMAVRTPFSQLERSVPGTYSLLVGVYRDAMRVCRIPSLLSTATLLGRTLGRYHDRLMHTLYIWNLCYLYIEYFRKLSYPSSAPRGGCRVSGVLWRISHSLTPSL